MKDVVEDSWFKSINSSKLNSSISQEEAKSIEECLNNMKKFKVSID